MARVLNNEVSILNIASLDNDIKDSFTRAMITEDVNTTSAAARRYLEGEYFIHNDRYLYKALEDIAAGTTITPDVNAEVVTVSEELVKLFAQSPEGIFEVLSNVESTSTASKNYVKGEQIIWTDKQLYTVTTDVTIGTTWAVGTNLALADNLTSQIKTLEETDNAMLNVLGAKNLLLSTATTQTVGEVTFTVDPKKRIVATNSVITTAQSVLNIVTGTVASLGLEAGEYIVSVGDGLSDSSYTSFFGIYDGSSWVRGAWLQDSPNFEYEFSITDAMLNNSNYTVTFYVRVESNVAAGSSHTFLPMIRPASVADDTYVPYAMTNRELTKNELRTKRVSITTSSVMGNTDYDVSYSSYIDTTKEVLSAVLCDGTTPTSTWDTILHPISVGLSELKYRFRAIGTTTQTYSVELVLFYHLK